MKRLLFIGICLLSWFFVPAQVQSFRGFVKAADQSFARQDYYNAFLFYATALEYNANHPNLWYRMGEAAQRHGIYHAADSAYRQMLERVEADTVAYTYFNLGEVNKRLGNYNDAAGFYQMVVDRPDNAPAPLRQQAQAQLTQIERARETMFDLCNVTVRHLDRGINTEYSDFGLARRGDTLYYTSFNGLFKPDTARMRRQLMRIYRKVGDQAPELMPESINPEKEHAAHTAFTADGRYVYFNRCVYVDFNNVRCDLYVSEVGPDGGWKTPQKLDINQSGTTTTAPSLGADEISGREYLYFASDRHNPEGDLDLYRAAVQPDGTLGRPEPLNALNTPGNERTPFFHTPSQTLYFSTDGRFTYGGYDLYRSTWDGRSFATPRNLGLPVNSSYNDLYYAQFPDTTLAYLSSNRPDSMAVYWIDSLEFCCNDIYAFEPINSVNLRVRTFNEMTETPTPLDSSFIVLYELLGDGERRAVDSLRNTAGHTFDFQVDIGRAYAISGRRGGFIPPPDTARIDLRNYDPCADGDTLQRDLYLGQLLEIFTFDEETGQPLSGVHLQLSYLRTNTLIRDETNPDTNYFRYLVPLEDNFLVQASRAGYEPATLPLEYSGEDLSTREGRLRFDVYLKPRKLDWTLLVFFDNAIPGPHPRTTTTARFDQLNDAYLLKKEEYITTQVAPEMTQEDIFLIRGRYNTFFDIQVEGGFDSLQVFMRELEQFLADGGEVTLEMRGFASPRGNDYYNQLLSERRINAVRNYMMTYNNGVLRRYFENGQVTVEPQALGESTADPAKVSEAFEDPKQSIYDVLAALERRVEIKPVIRKPTNPN